MSLLAALDRFNRAHPWSHNDAFAGFVLRHARNVKRIGGQTAMDVGCGTGNLVERLSRVFPGVIGVEPDPSTAGIAEAHFSNSGSVRIEQRRFGQEEPGRYDLIVYVASLHHMPLAATLHEAKRCLRRDGRIVIVGVARETPADKPRALISLILNPLVGLVRHPSSATQPPAAHASSYRDCGRVLRGDSVRCSKHHARHSHASSAFLALHSDVDVDSLSTPCLSGPYEGDVGKIAVFWMIEDLRNRLRCAGGADTLFRMVCPASVFADLPQSIHEGGITSMLHHLSLIPSSYWIS